MNLLKDAKNKGISSLSEYQSKLVLSEYGIPITKEYTADTEDEAVSRAMEIGYPVAVKGCGTEFSHKTEMDLIVLNLQDEHAVRGAFQKLTSHKSVNQVLVQQMVKGDRELLAGLIRDAQFGPSVMFGLGGVLTEVLEDVSFRVAPLSHSDALDMMQEIRAKKILDAFRGQPPVDREMLADLLVRLGQVGIENSEIREIDINPIKLIGGKPVAVDALIVLGK